MFALAAVMMWLFVLPTWQTADWMTASRCDGSLAKQLPVIVELSCKPFTCDVNVAPTDDGRYQCTYTPHRPGFYRLEVMSQGIHLLGSPFSVKVLFGYNLCACVLAGCSCVTLPQN